MQDKEFNRRLNLIVLLVNTWECEAKVQGCTLTRLLVPLRLQFLLVVSRALFGDHDVLTRTSCHHWPLML